MSATTYDLLDEYNLALLAWVNDPTNKKKRKAYEKALTALYEGAIAPAIEKSTEWKVTL